MLHKTKNNSESIQKYYMRTKKIINFYFLIYKKPALFLKRIFENVSLSLYLQIILCCSKRD